MFRENSLSERKYTDTHSMHNNIFSCVVRIVVGDGDDDNSGSSGERKRESKASGQRRPRVSLLGCDVR